MSGLKKVGSAGRYGPRYGRKTRFKVKTVDELKNSSQECPNCNKLTIKRLVRGIYECSSCGAKLTGMTYTLK